jgi:sigma-E factor negative regulatory protein RseB
MSLRRLSACTFTFAALAFVSPAWGEGAASGASAAHRDVRGWLVRIHEAAGRQNFQGTFVVSSPGHVASARMAHFWEGSNQYERIESLDGQKRDVYRYNDTVHTVWPANGVAVVEQRALTSSFPALLQSGNDGVSDWYEVEPRGEDRVAGHAADVLLVKPKDDYRYGYRLWSDKASGLLLRADVLDPHGDVLETSAFSDITIGVRPRPESVLQPMRHLDRYRVLRPILSPTELEAEGWTMREPAPGFRLVSCVSRQMDRPRAEGAVMSDRRVLQAIFADGMTYVSLFIEPYRESRHTRPMATVSGATQTLSVRHGDWWVTVVGDVPASTLRFFANALERRN